MHKPQSRSANRGALAAAIVSSLLCAITARAQFTPVPLSSSSFNQDVVVEKTAPPAVVPGGFTTASMDGGTNNTGDTWNEQGYFAVDPAVGLPPAGSTLTSLAAPDHQYQLAPSYTTNDAVMLDATGFTNGATLTVTSPAGYGALSFLTSGGNGGCTFQYVVHHQDGSTEAGITASADWFNGANPAFIANGRVNAQTFALDNYNSQNPRLYSKDVTLTNATSPVTSIDFHYVSSAAGAHTCIMAVSGATTPGAAFTPLAVTGYNADIVVEANANKPASLGNVTTATMDQGIDNYGTTWYEQGYATNVPLSGLPPAGTTFTNVPGGDHSFIMPSSYTAANAAYVDPFASNAIVTLTTPAAFTGLSLLTAAGNGPAQVSLVVHHQDNSSELQSLNIPDWFGNSPVAYIANGRVDVTNGVFENIGSGNPRLYSVDVVLTNTTSPVTSLDLNYTATNGRAVLFAVGGTTGPIRPLFTLQPNSVTVSAGANVTLNTSVSGTAPINLQWQIGSNGVFTDISGAITTNFSLSNVGDANSADYRVVASNAAGAVTSSVATVTVLLTTPPVTLTTDPITAFGGASPANEGVANAIDQTTAKYLNLGGGTGPSGFVVTPSTGRTIVTGIRFYVANDAPERDPADYRLEGSNDGGHSYTLISSNALTLPDARNTSGAPLDPATQVLQQVSFPNSIGFTTYRVTFSHVKNPALANSMQIGEVELLGTPDTSGFPAVTTPPLSQNVFAGSTLTLSSAASGTPAPSLQWQKGTNGVYSPLVNGGNVSGAQTATLTLNPVGLNDTGDYILVATNSVGSASSSPATITVLTNLPDITSPSDVINGFGDLSAGYWGESTNAQNAIDNTYTSYQNGGSGFSSSAGFPPFSGPVGLVVTPASGPSVVVGLRIYTAATNPERDPADYKLEGSNDGTTFTSIASGPLALPEQRNDPAQAFDPLTAALQEVEFTNSLSFTTYRVTFMNTKDNTTANSLQIGELELLGAGSAVQGPRLSIAAGPGQTILITTSAPGELFSTTALQSSGTVWQDEGPITDSKTVAATGTARFFRVRTP